MTNKCEYCKLTLKTESGFEKHACQNKKRFLKMKETMPAYIMWTMFMKHHGLYRQYNVDNSEQAKMKAFARSNQYLRFVKYQKWVEKIDPVDPMEYFQYLLDSEVPFKRWRNEEFYMQWMKKWVFHEEPDAAVTRTIVQIMEICRNNDIDIHEYQEALTPNRMALWIRSGKISPWFIFLSDKAKTLFAQIPEDEIGRLEDMINPTYWKMKMKKFPETNELKQQLQKAGL